MKKIFPVVLTVLLAVACPAGPARAGDPQYKNFKVAVYARRGTIAQWGNPQTLAAAYDNMTRQVRFDKVYLEIVTGRQAIDDATIESIKKFFTDKGIEVAAAAVLGGSGGQAAGPSGGSLSLAVPADRDVIKRAAELAARHFDEIILDDWYFTASKLPADIAAKGDKTWSEYRVEAFDEASKSLMVDPAHAINPKFKAVVKYPNWYEHYQALGYDLEKESKIFDGIYTGVETRDPTTWEQHLQQYESYNIMRYLENVRPGANGGGWVDTLFTHYADRYPEQIWDTAFSKPKEICLWNWDDALGNVAAGTRPWENTATSFDLKKMNDSFAGPGTARSGHVASYALTQVDAFLGKLGKPIGIAGYRPPHAIGEDYYYDFLGTAGFPIELHPDFPTDAPVCLLTEGSRIDPDLVKKIKGQLAAGKNVIITSGLLKALMGKGAGGIEDITELEYTDHKVSVTSFRGRNESVIAGEVNPPISFPIIHWITNQSWGWVNGFDKASPAMAYPLVISDAYSAGTIYVLNLPDNIADLYRLPPEVLGAIRTRIMGSFPTQLASAPGQVSLFAYDNNTFIVQSFLPAETTVTLSTIGAPGGITDLVSNATIAPAPAGGGGRGRGGAGGGRGAPAGPPRSTFTITIPAHSFRAFAPAAAPN